MSGQQTDDQQAGGTGERFREVQPLHQNWVVRFVVPFETAIMLAIVIPVLATSSGGAWSPGSVVAGGLILGLPLCLLSIRMTTIVTRRELIVRYRPFPGRRLPIGSIRRAEAITYSPLESGGWGWRTSRTFHRVLNVSGDRGVHVVHGDTKKDQFLIGSRRADELAEAIELARFDSEQPGD